MAAPLLLWMFLQLPALLFVRHSASAMLIIEFAAAAMLFTYLLRDLRTTGAMILGAAIMLALAAHRSGTPMYHIIGPWACVAIWLTGLTFASRAPARFRSSIGAFANLLTFGGLVIWYLANDFGGSDAAAVASFSPLVLALRLM